MYILHLALKSEDDVQTTTTYHRHVRDYRTDDSHDVVSSGCDRPLRSDKISQIYTPYTDRTQNSVVPNVRLFIRMVPVPLLNIRIPFLSNSQLFVAHYLKRRRVTLFVYLLDMSN